MSIQSESVVTANRAIGNKQSPRTNRRRDETRRQSTRMNAEGLEPGAAVFPRINPAQAWTIINKDPQSGLWLCRNDRGSTREFFAHELQRIDEAVSMQCIWKDETLHKWDSSLSGRVVEVSREHNYVVLLLDTGTPILLLPLALKSWHRTAGKGGEK